MGPCSARNFPANPGFIHAFFLRQQHMKTTIATLLTSLVLTILPQDVLAQQPPSMGYMFPSGGQAGQTVEVILGGYDWTPDMQLFVHDPQVQLEIIGSPGPVIVPEPPYWFGKKSRRAPEPLPREIKARLTIPANIPPGIVTWQAANANGATEVGRFVVNDIASIVEQDEPAWPDTESGPQQIESVPVCVSGQIKHIREVDRYRFSPTRSGPVTCNVVARAIGSQLNAVLEVYDPSGRLIADAADTAGNDTALTFTATANESYIAAVYDLDFRGDRAMVYQFSIRQGPRVISAIPSVGRRGETRSVEFVGVGIATGQSKLESVLRDVMFPDDPNSDSFLHQLITEHGECPPFRLHLSDQLQQDENTSILVVPAGVTGVLDQRFGEERYRFAAKKGEILSVDVSTEKTGSQVDAALTIYDHDGKQLDRNDDQTDSTDAEIEFTIPADGDYSVGVSDVASQSGTRAATYHLCVRPATPGFRLSVPELLNAPLGGKASLAVKVTRHGGFKDAIDVTLTGLPVGVTVADNLQVAANQNAVSVELNVATEAAASAALVNVVGTAATGEQPLQQTVGPVLVATTIKPPFVIDAEGQDDVTKWPRGTTFPAPVLISRDEGFNADIVLEMTSRQGRHRQGISGPELVVPNGINRILYPVYLPEWLETTRTSRMVVNGVAQVADPKGNIRHSVARQKTRMGFLPTGALLKISASQSEFTMKPGQELNIPISIDRSEKLIEPVTLELICDDSQHAFLTAKPQTLTGDVVHSDFPVTVASSAPRRTEHRFMIRATLLKEGTWPVISETQVSLELID